jgi:hypothetical protein
MLTPYMTFPAYLSTSENRPAVVLGYYLGRYHGFVEFNDSFSDDYRILTSWDAEGKVLYNDGSVDVWSEDRNLVDPNKTYDDAYDQLPSAIQTACDFIYLAASARNQKINGIRALRAVVTPMPGLAQAKRWYEHTIPARLGTAQGLAA